MHKEFNILFKGLKQGKHAYNYQIDKKFFESFTLVDFLDADINAKLNLQKKTTLLDLNFSIEGKVLVNCDVSGKEYWQEIEGNLEIIVKFGNEYNDDDEIVLILPHSAYDLNVAQYFYELVVFSIPIKRVQSSNKNETLKFDLKKLENSEKNNIKKQEIDPRWEKLKKLL